MPTCLILLNVPEIIPLAITVLQPAAPAARRIPASLSMPATDQQTAQKYSQRQYDPAFEGIITFMCSLNKYDII